MSNSISVFYYKSPLGELILGSYQDKICLADWRYRKMRKRIDDRIQKGLQASYVKDEAPIIRDTIKQLDEYFKGNRLEFEIPLVFIGTEFQKIVWNELIKIPYGKTCSYLELSQNLGDPKAIRAVANANGANAISIIVPCHRIIGADGNLTGYAGGLRVKRKLLDLEKINSGQSIQIRLKL